MGGHNARTCWESRGLMLLWLAVLSGPAAWTLNLLVGYALVKPVCANHSSLTPPVLSVVALVMSLGGAWLAWTFVARLRGAREERGREGRVQVDRSHFIGVVAVSLNLLLALLIVT